MTENHFNTTPGNVDSTKPLTEYTLEELKGDCFKNSKWELVE